MAVCWASAERVMGQIDVVVAPPLPVGISGHHLAFPDSLTLLPSTFVNAVFETGHSFIYHGFKRLR